MLGQDHDPLVIVHGPWIHVATMATALAALALGHPAQAASDAAILILDVSEDSDVDADLLEDLADQLVYFADTEVVDTQCVRSAERAARLGDAVARHQLEGLIDTAEASYEDFDTDGAWTSLQQAGSQMATLDPLALGPLLARFCRLGVLVSIDRGDPAAVEQQLQCLVSVQPWFEPAPGLFDPDTEARIEDLRGELADDAATLDWDSIEDGITVIVDGFEVGPDDDILLVPGVHLIQTSKVGFAPVRRRVHVDGEVVVTLEPPTVPRWDRAARDRVRTLLDDEERADRDPAVRGLMASCEADRALLLFTEWDGDIRSTAVGLVRARHKGWAYIGRFDTHQLVDRIGEVLAPVETDLTAGPPSKPVMGTLGWSFGVAARLRSPADERLYAGAGLGLGLQPGLHLRRHLHVGLTAVFSLLGNLPSGSNAEPNSYIFQETLAWVDLGLESEYIDGVPLRRILELSEPLTTHEALAVACGLAEALDYLHCATGPDGRAMRLVHRNLMPENVLLSPSGEIKVGGFGLATYVDRSMSTTTVELRGRLGYISPEQIDGKPPHPRSDLFSLGILLYELLAGRSPFPGPAPGLVFDQIVSGQHPPLREQVEIPLPGIAELVEELLRVSPLERPEDARAVWLRLWSLRRELGAGADLRGLRHRARSAFEAIEPPAGP